MSAVFFYISGHGFGHSVRQIEIINALVALAPAELRVFVRTSAPPWLFARSAHPSVILLPGKVDTGVVQIDSLRLDERATIERARAFYDELPRRTEEEVKLLGAHDARLVMTDAAPLACGAAKQAGIPGVVCSNFTWDWIYREYGETCASAGPVIDTIGSLYSEAAAGWRLPMHGGFETVRPITDLPLVARHATTTRTRHEIRSTLGLPNDARLALVSFGGYGVSDLPLDRLDCTSEWLVVITTRDAETGSLPHGVAAVTERAICEGGVKYQDVVRAVDAVISKPGYGIISDCVANGAALLYTSRGRFAEYGVLVREMPRLLRCGFIPMEDFLAGRWREALNALSTLPAPQAPRTDGAQVVARMILEWLPGFLPPEGGRSTTSTSQPSPATRSSESSPSRSKSAAGWPE